MTATLARKLAPIKSAHTIANFPNLYTGYEGSPELIVLHHPDQLSTPSGLRVNHWSAQQRGFLPIYYRGLGLTLEGLLADLASHGDNGGYPSEPVDEFVRDDQDHPAAIIRHLGDGKCGHKVTLL